MELSGLDETGVSVVALFFFLLKVPSQRCGCWGDPRVLWWFHLLADAYPEELSLHCSAGGELELLFCVNAAQATYIPVL